MRPGPASRLSRRRASRREGLSAKCACPTIGFSIAAVAHGASLTRSRPVSSAPNHVTDALSSDHRRPRALARPAASRSRAPPGARRAEELAEVTRLHHAGQSAAALERADEYLATQSEGCADAIPEVRSSSPIPVGAAEAIRRSCSSSCRTIPSSPSRTTTSRRCTRPTASTARRAPNWRRRCASTRTMRRRNENLGDVLALLAGQSYARALRLEPASTTLPKKLALIRQLRRPSASRDPPPRAATGASPRCGAARPVSFQPNLLPHRTEPLDALVPLPLLRRARSPLRRSSPAAQRSRRRSSLATQRRRHRRRARCRRRRRRRSPTSCST